MRYEAAAVIRAAEIEIKEYFAIFSEDDALNIMEVRSLQNKLKSLENTICWVNEEEALLKFDDLVSLCLSIPIIP